MKPIKIFSCALLLSSSLAALDWPFFKNDAARTSSQSATLKPPLELKWTADLGAQGIVSYSSPIVVGNQVFSATPSGRVLSFDLSPSSLSGGFALPLHQFQTDAPIYGSPAHAVVAGQGRVFIGSTDGYLYCLKASDLTLVWKQGLGNATFSSPVVYTISGSTLVACGSQDGSLRAFDAGTGAPAWSVETGSYVFASPAFDGARLFVPSYDKKLYAVNALNGVSSWQGTLSSAGRSSPALAGGNIFELDNAGNLMTWVAASGAPGPVPTKSFGAAASSSLAVGQLGSATVLAFGLEDGRVILTDPLSATPFLWQKSISNFPIISSPAIANSFIYIGSNDGSLAILSLADGVVRGKLGFGGSVQISPAIGQNTLLAASSKGELKAFGMAVDRFAISGASLVSNGTAFSYTLTALDIDGNLVPSYSGKANLSLQGGGSSSITSNPPNPLAFDAGSAQVSVTYNLTGNSAMLLLKDTLKDSVTGKLDVSIQVATSTPTPVPCLVPQTCYQIVNAWGEGAGGPGTGTGGGEFGNPRGVAIASDLAGNVYVVDSINHIIQKFDSNGTFLLQWGGLGSSDGQFNVPLSIAIDGGSNVYVTDLNNRRVQKFNSNGAFLGKWGGLGAGTGLFNAPFGIAISQAGDIYVSDAGTNLVQRFDLNGIFVQQWGGSGSANGQFAGPAGLAVDSQGNVYVADSGNHRIQKFTFTGSYLIQWAQGSFDTPPYGVATDTCDLVYVVQNGSQLMQKYTSSGSFITDFGDISGVTSRVYNGFVGVALDDSVYSTTDLGQVYKFGACTTLASQSFISSPKSSKLSHSAKTLLRSVFAQGPASATEAWQATPTPTSTPTPEIQWTPTELPSPTVTLSLTMVPTDTFVPMPAPTDTLEPSPLATNTPEPTSTPVPTFTAEPTPALAISGLMASPNPFSPHAGESTTINFSLSKAASVGVTIFDKQGRQVRKWAASNVSPAGSNGIVWEGKDDEGHNVAPGLEGYKVVVSATAGLETATGVDLTILVNP